MERVRTGDMLILSFYLEAYSFAGKFLLIFQSPDYMAYPLGHHPSLAPPRKSLAVSVSLLLQENCEVCEDRVQTRHTLPFWKKHKEGAQYLLAECLFLSVAAAAGDLGRLRGAGIGDGSPFSPSSFLPFAAMDSERDVGEARQESDF